MLPIMIDPNHVVVALVGKGDLLARRERLLRVAGIENLKVFDQSLPTKGELSGVSLLFIAGLGNAEAETLAGLARGLGILVNTEDNKPLCDFHVPASVRRGELLMTVSTGGRSPGLARRLRQHLDIEFGDEWAGFVDELAAERLKWRQEGHDLKAVAAKSNNYIDRKGWLK
jgi:precorrin-2 dehydrogenase